MARYPVVITAYFRNGDVRGFRTLSGICPEEGGFAGVYNREQCVVYVDCFESVIEAECWLESFLKSIDSTDNYGARFRFD